MLGLSVHEIIAMGRWKTASMVYRYGIQDERDINASAAKLAAAA